MSCTIFLFSKNGFTSFNIKVTEEVFPEVHKVRSNISKIACIKFRIHLFDQSIEFGEDPLIEEGYLGVLKLFGIVNKILRNISNTKSDGLENLVS